MITGAIKNNARNGSTLIVTLPCSLYDLRNHLASIGITSEASKLTVGGTENIKVQLAAAEPVGELVLSKLAQDDTLTGLNVACQEIRRNCPFGIYGYAPTKKRCGKGQILFLSAVLRHAAQHGHRRKVSDRGS